MATIDISGIKPTLPLRHLGMTVNDGTIGLMQYRLPFSGVINNSIQCSPTIATISGKYDNRWDNVEYYSGDTGNR